MRLGKIVSFACFLILFFACNNQSVEKLIINERRLNEIILNLKTPIIVYYHSGECSMCYGALHQISIDFPESTIISLATLNNEDLIDSYLESIDFKGFSVIDSSSVFLCDNQKLLQTSNLFLIDSVSTVLYRSSEYNRKESERIKIIIKKKVL